MTHSPPTMSDDPINQLSLPALIQVPDAEPDVPFDQFERTLRVEQELRKIEAETALFGVREKELRDLRRKAAEMKLLQVDEKELEAIKADLRPSPVNPAVFRDPSKLAGKEVYIDPHALYVAAGTMASMEQLAVIFGVSENTLMRDEYHDIIKSAQANMNLRLRGAQYATAIEDRNPTMQIWLGKQYLGQRDVSRVETVGANGGPVQTENKTMVQAVAYFPENGREEAPPAEGTPAIPAHVENA